MLGDAPGEEDRKKKNWKDAKAWNMCTDVRQLLPSLLIQSHQVYTERIASVSMESGLSHCDLCGCATAEQNLFGFVWNIQVRWLHLVKSIRIKKETGFLVAFVPFSVPHLFRQQQDVTHEENSSKETQN